MLFWKICEELYLLVRRHCSVHEIKRGQNNEPNKLGAREIYPPVETIKSGFILINRKKLLSKAATKK